MRDGRRFRDSGDRGPKRSAERVASKLAQTAESPRSRHAITEEGEDYVRLASDRLAGFHFWDERLATIWSLDSMATISRRCCGGGGNSRGGGRAGLRKY